MNLYYELQTDLAWWEELDLVTINTQSAAQKGLENAANET